ncbi:MAG: glycoside hydrolase family 127 protein [Armatimonadota bacterium]
MKLGVVLGLMAVVPAHVAAQQADGGVRMKRTESTAVVDTSSSPSAHLRSAALDAVQWTEGYWAERHRQNCQVTLRRLWELLADPDAGHVLDNFRIAAGAQEGEFAGTNWQDEWLYKWLEAAACTYRVTGDEWIARRMDEAIELIGSAQEDDGYIATQITARGKPRFQEVREHEVYNMGHLLTAGVIHRRMTGKDSLLRIAIRAGDFLCSVLGVSVSPSFAHNPSAVMGLVELYRETGESKYLECARVIVDGRGSKPKRGWLFNMPPGIAGTDQIQDRVPLREAKEVVGHNVFFTYLFAGAADVYLETGDETLRDPLLRMWRDLTARKMSVNGGVSPMGHGLSLRNDPVVEAVGPAYFLPSAAAYNETCGQIGNMMWNYRMLCTGGEARYADIMELEIYNGILSGIGLDGASWWYRNPLRRYDSAHVPRGHNDMLEREEPGRRRICCPSNLVRTVAEWQSYLYGTSDDGLWIHHYGGNAFSGTLSPGESIALEQKTDYPWDGKIAITVREAPGRSFAIRLRVPGWATSAAITVNGDAADVPAEPGAYAAIERPWSAGDVIELDLPMPARLVQAHPQAEQLRNQVAVTRGPVLYCLESPDLPDGADLSNVYIPSDIALEPVAADDLPFGIRMLEGTGLYRREPAWGDALYRTLPASPMEPIRLRMLPYFAWANRGPSAMAVWHPLLLRTP